MYDVDMQNKRTMTVIIFRPSNCIMNHQLNVQFIHEGYNLNDKTGPTLWNDQYPKKNINDFTKDLLFYIFQT